MTVNPALLDTTSAPGRLSIRGTSYFLPMIETAEPPSEGVMLMA